MEIYLNDQEVVRTMLPHDGVADRNPRVCARLTLMVGKVPAPEVSREFLERIGATGPLASPMQGALPVWRPQLSVLPLRRRSSAGGGRSPMRHERA